MPTLQQRLIKIAVRLVDLAALRHGRRLARLNADEAGRWLRPRLAPPSALLRLVRDLLVLAYFDQPAIKQRLGYDPETWTAQVAARRQREWANELKAHAQLVIAPIVGEEDA